MTKTLTEQWRKGKLPTGEYYIKLDDGSFTTDRYYGECFGFSEEIPDKVLAPVPSYEEWQSCDKCADMLIGVNKKWEKTIKERKKLEKKLEIATKALKEYADSSNWYETDDFGISAIDQFACDDYGYNIAQQALKEMEGVK